MARFCAAACVIACAAAIPVQTVTNGTTLTTTALVLSDFIEIADLDAVGQVLADAAGFDTTVDVTIAFDARHRRLQSGNGVALRVSYRVLCTNDCSAVTDSINTLITDPTAGAAHAASLIAAVSDLASSNGFSNAVLSTVSVHDNQRLSIPPP